MSTKLSYKPVSSTSGHAQAPAGGNRKKQNSPKNKDEGTKGVKAAPKYAHGVTSQTGAVYVQK